jgi:hypothetical protein
MMVVFACRRGRLRDIALLKAGIQAAAHRLWVLTLPWSYPLLALLGIARRIGMPVYLVLSDKFAGDMLIARLFGVQCTRMLWNYADEWPAAGIRLPAHRVCFFEEKGQPAQVFQFAPQPVAAPPIRAVTAVPVSRPIVFIGDVSLDFALPRGAQWWLDQYEALIAEDGYTFYLQARYEQLLEQLPTAGDRRTARLLAKNLLRLRIVTSTRQHFQQALVLVGSNWRRFGLDSEPSAYAEAARLDYYRSAIVNLDCGSKSGAGALYPRCSELISCAGGLLQVGCMDSARVFGARQAEFTFTDEATLVQCLQVRLAESREARASRDEWLLAHLRRQGLLMQNSVSNMIETAARSPSIA